ncbi:MAG: glycosyltransferase family 39 protein [Anaerolineae bacterium]|nr:glycosyltransferase family 39 protein [Anaerolineae bacterium]
MREARLFLQQYGGLGAAGLAALMALLLPLNLLTSQPFHYDEALYATWALTITNQVDPWLSATPIDKPPLFLWLVAGSFRLLGATTTTARLPSLLATPLIVLLTYGLGRRLYSEATGILAAWLGALSPFTLLFAPTALTDPTLVTLVLSGCLAATVGRSVWAGVFAALAIATKQQGVFFVPLIAGFLVISRLQGCKVAGEQGSKVARGKAPGIERDEQNATSHVLRLLVYFFLSLSLSLLPFIVWDLTRSQPSAFFQQSINNYGGLAFDLAGFNERWSGFLDLLWYGTGSVALNIVFVVGLPFLIAYDLITTLSQPPTSNHQLPISQSPLPDLHLILFSLAFLVLHTVFSFQIWDRYLLGLIPLLALLLARVLLLPWAFVRYLLPRVPSLKTGLRAIFSLGLVILLAATLTQPIQDAIHARYPLGSNSRAVTGIEQIVNYLQGNVGADTTLYHRWLGTYWRFYLWNYPYDLQFWGSPAELIAKARPGHLIAFPAWRSDTEARLALFEAGFGLHELARAYKADGSPSVILYRIEALAE